MTRPETLRQLWNGIDAVLSSVGITCQSDAVTQMDVAINGWNQFLIGLRVPRFFWKVSAAVG